MRRQAQDIGARMPGDGMRQEGKLQASAAKMCQLWGEPPSDVRKMLIRPVGPSGNEDGQQPTPRTEEKKGKEKEEVEAAGPRKKKPEVQKLSSPTPD